MCLSFYTFAPLSSWWNGMCYSIPLTKEAAGIFNMLSTSAAVRVGKTLLKE